MLNDVFDIVSLTAGQQYFKTFSFIAKLFTFSESFNPLVSDMKAVLLK